MSRPSMFVQPVAKSSGPIDQNRCALRYDRASGNGPRLGDEGGSPTCFLGLMGTGKPYEPGCCVETAYGSSAFSIRWLAVGEGFKDAGDAHDFRRRWCGIAGKSLAARALRGSRSEP